jgi:hypothetical protein
MIYEKVPRLKSYKDVFIGVRANGLPYEDVVIDIEKAVGDKTPILIRPSRFRAMGVKGGMMPARNIKRGYAYRLRIHSRSKNVKMVDYFSSSITHEEFEKRLIEIEEELKEVEESKKDKVIDSRQWITLPELPFLPVRDEGILNAKEKSVLLKAALGGIFTLNKNELRGEVIIRSTPIKEKYSGYTLGLSNLWVSSNSRIQQGEIVDGIKYFKIKGVEFNGASIFLNLPAGTPGGAYDNINQYIIK